MAYCGECDGHDRAWHIPFARSRAEFAELQAGATAAAADLKRDLDAFTPDRNVVPLFPLPLDVDFD